MANQVYLRDPKAGELGWIVKVHGEYYSQEYGYGPAFEGIVADIVARYAAEWDDPEQFCWIADIEGKPIGSVMLTRDADRMPWLRVMFIIEAARGRGVGRMLGQAVLDAARACGDPSIILWTTNKQIVARCLYELLGFRCISSKPNTTFDPTAMDELWRLEF